MSVLNSVLKYKICIFGDGGVGKTTLTQRYLTGVFKEKYQLTIGMDFYLKKLNFDGKDISLYIWDFAGEEKFRFLMPAALVGAHVVIFMYDITRYITLKNLNNWIAVYKEAKEKENQDIIVVIVGSKLDLTELRTIPKEVGEEMVEKHGLNGWIECSAKDGTNVEKIFEDLTRGLIQLETSEKKNKKLMFFV
ncbi:MAG: Rab family GTPase [Promethearchaeota archaeon]